MKKQTLIHLLETARSLNVRDEDEADKVIDAIVIELGDNITSDTKSAVVKYVVGEISLQDTLRRLGQ